MCSVYIIWTLQAIERPIASKTSTRHQRTGLGSMAMNLECRGLKKLSSVLFMTHEHRRVYEWQKRCSSTALRFPLPLIPLRLIILRLV
jgi:hypothetical protein